LYFTAARVLAAVLTGIGFSATTAIAATDSILQAIGKLQAQISALFKIPAGGAAGQVLSKIDGTDGNTQWVTPSSGSGSPGGSPGQIQFNNGGSFEGSSNLTWDNTNDVFYAKVKQYGNFSIDSVGYTSLAIQSAGTIFGYLGSGQSALHTGTSDIILQNANGGVISLEAGQIYLHGTVNYGASGNFNTLAANSYNQFNFSNSGPFYWYIQYKGVSSQFFGFTNAGNGLTTPQNKDDLLVNCSANFCFWDGTDNQNNVYACFSPSTKSLIINGGGDFTTDDSAVLKLDSTSRGFLPTRMTTSQKNSISSPTEGLIVYDNTLHKLCVFTGGLWETVSSS
jgi:hypothetical protein